MSTGKLALGAFVSFLLSLAVFVAMAALLSWFYYAFYLSNPEVQFDPSRFAWVKRFCIGLAWFIPLIGLWWLVVLLAGGHRIVAGGQAPVHRLFARADLWLLLAALLWGLLNYAAATRRFPTELFACGQEFGLMGTCVGPKRSLFWSVAGVAGILFLIGLVLRVMGIRRAATEAAG